MTKTNVLLRMWGVAEHKGVGLRDEAELAKKLAAVANKPSEVCVAPTARLGPSPADGARAARPLLPLQRLAGREGQ